MVVANFTGNDGGRLSAFSVMRSTTCASLSMRMRPLYAGTMCSLRSYSMPHWEFTCYSVEQVNSQWGIEYERKEHIVPAYSGRILIDKDAHVVLRITLNADNLPPSFPVKLATTILDYDYTDISGHPFLLPLKSETQMSADGVLSRNDTEFRLYRKYRSEGPAACWRRA